MLPIIKNSVPEKKKSKVFRSLRFRILYKIKNIESKVLTAGFAVYGDALLYASALRSLEVAKHSWEEIYIEFK